jgi:hypothetical protein
MTGVQWWSRHGRAAGFTLLVGALALLVLVRAPLPGGLRLVTAVVLGGFAWASVASLRASFRRNVRDR